MHKLGDVILVDVQFTDSAQRKLRPAVVLFEEFGNIIVAGITSNPKMNGIPLTKKEGATVDSVIKLNYIFTLTAASIRKRLFTLSREKKQRIWDGMAARLSGFKE